MKVTFVEKSENPHVTVAGLLDEDPTRVVYETRAQLAFVTGARDTREARVALAAEDRAFSDAAVSVHTRTVPFVNAHTCTGFAPAA